MAKYGIYKKYAGFKQGVGTYEYKAVAYSRKMPADLLDEGFSLIAQADTKDEADGVVALLKDIQKDKINGKW